MIGFTELGKWGRLGNQLWEIAFILGLSAKTKVPYVLPQWDYQGYFKNKLNQGTLSGADIVHEKGHLWQSFTLLPNKKYDFRGYFQSLLYFSHCESTIRDAFEFNNSFKALNDIYDVEDSIAIHVRRGDYVDNPNYVNLGKEYYDGALKQMNGQRLVFSDDPEYAKTIIGNAQVVELDEVSSLYLMTQCKKHVVANSSFSFWGAWLSESSEVIRPKAFYKGRLKLTFPLTQYYPKSWVSMG